MIYIFDLDGTLTYPRHKMIKENEKFFLEWIKTHVTYLITGSNYEKVQEQLSTKVIMNLAGVFPCQGNQFYKENNIVYHRSYQFNSELLNDLEEKRITSKSPVSTNTFFELRPGMLNFTTIGRAATDNERNEYNIWDENNGERDSLVEFINHKYGHIVQASKGGMISIDIAPIGADKSQILPELRQTYNVDDAISFYGDKMQPGENDYSLKLALLQENWIFEKNNQIFAVKDQEHTINLIKDI